MSSMYAMTELPLRLTIFCTARAIARWKVADALHKPNGIRRHSKSPNSQAKAVLWRSAFRKGICQKAQASSMLV